MSPSCPCSRSRITSSSGGILGKPSRSRPGRPSGSRLSLDGRRPRWAGSDAATSGVDGAPAEGFSPIFFGGKRRHLASCSLRRLGDGLVCGPTPIEVIAHLLEVEEVDVLRGVDDALSREHPRDPPQRVADEHVLLRADVVRVVVAREEGLFADGDGEVEGTPFLRGGAPLASGRRAQARPPAHRPVRGSPGRPRSRRADTAQPLMHSLSGTSPGRCRSPFQFPPWSHPYARPYWPMRPKSSRASPVSIRRSLASMTASCRKLVKSSRSSPDSRIRATIR